MLPVGCAPGVITNKINARLLINHKVNRYRFFYLLRHHLRLKMQPPARCSNHWCVYIDQRKKTQVRTKKICPAPKCCIFKFSPLARGVTMHTLRALGVVFIVYWTPLIKNRDGNTRYLGSCPPFRIVSRWPPWKKTKCLYSVLYILV